PADGSPARFINSKATVERNEAGDPVSIIGTVQDITDRKHAEDNIRRMQAELEEKISRRTLQLSIANDQLKEEIESGKKASAALKETLDKLHKIADRVPGVVYQYRLNPDGTSCFPFASEGLREIYRVSPKEVVDDASAVFSSLHPDDIEDVVSSIQASARDLTLWRHEYRVKFDNGDVRWVLGNAMPQCEADGSVLWHGFISDITDRKKIENDLEQVSARLSLAARAGGVGVWDYDIVNNILVWDDQMFALYGITKEDFSGAYDAWQAGLHPDDKVQGDAEIQAAIRGEKEFDTEFRVVWPDGTIRNIRALAIVEHDKSGNPVNLIGTNWDITDQKQAEILLDQTRRNYETFFNTIDDFLFVLDSQGNMIHVNETVLTRLGYSFDELRDQSVLMVHPPERREEAGRIVGEMLAGTADFCPVPLIEKSGNPISVETRVKTGFWDGKPVIFGVSKDVSKIKLSEEKFSKAFHTNAALMAISSFDEARFIDVNETLINTLGYSRDELIGKTSDELKLFDDHAMRKIFTGQLKQNIPVRDIEVVARTKSGVPIIGLFSAVSIYIGKDLCLLTMMVDITERKRIEEEYRKARIEADNANLAKSEFLSRMSHELRTPMNSILGFAQLMQMDVRNQAHQKGVNHILTSGKHLLNLINEVLDISRIEAGRLSLSLEPVKLSGVIPEVIDIVHQQAVKRHVSIKLVNSPVNQLFVRCDNQRIRQVLLNLLNNAIKYNRTGGSVLIQTDLMPENADGFVPVRISVTDTGKGISAPDLPKLFKPFERIGAEKSETEGTGLGLTVVKKLMEAMGGTLGVKSVPGTGSTFWIELPMIGSQKSKLPQAINSGSEHKPVTGKTGTILYIEDNIPNAELVEEILEIHRPEIKLISSIYGKHAVKLAIEHSPVIILLDLDLPDIHGSQVLRNLQADVRTKSIPVIIISADAMPQQIERMMKSGPMDYLTKPLDIAAFLKTVDEWIGIMKSDEEQ
ncbi:MAG: PAS domain S-box protein, partial [Bacteroidota bacterium]